MGTLQILHAGAGTGKTTRLSNEIVKTIMGGVAPEHVMAITFTNKAADELIERIRIKLLNEGEREKAARILEGYVGTMNGVFGRLLQEYSLDLGFSPVQTVLLPEQASALFSIVTAESFEEFRRELDPVFRRLSLEDWRKLVLDLIQMARQNDIPATRVADSATYSWAALSRWLPDATGNAETLEEELVNVIKRSLDQLPGGDQTRSTAGAIEELRSLYHHYERDGELTWHTWAKLSKLSGARASEHIFSQIRASASVHPLHPGLHRDLQIAIEGVFRCVATLMEQFAQAKKERGLIDYTDQESLVLQLVHHPVFEQRVKERIECVFVDEFQDCSPMELALINRLRAIIPSSVWVGDPKQAIFGFKGADPQLMQSALETLTDAEKSNLSTSYRSRPSLVECVNDLFVSTFATVGMSKDEVALTPDRSDHPDQGVSLQAWQLTAKNNEQERMAIAAGVAEMLAEPDEHKVEDRVSKTSRSLRPADMAVLCRSNAECAEIADALAKVGVRATVGKSGLLSTPEAIVAVAALRYLVDSRDTVALAELLHLGSDHNTNGEWLADFIEDPPKEPFLLEPRIAALERQRPRIRHMSPSEVFDTAVSAAKIDLLTASWGEADQRLANLDALRGLAKQYEESAQVERTSATAAGLILYLQSVQRDGDDQVAESEDTQAVRVVTYHSAKGLEWPVVILTSLNKSSVTNGPPPVFRRPHPITKDGHFQSDHPLRNRVIRYWPWPYAMLSKDVGFDGYVANAPELAEIKRLNLEENTRLMYVGMTRARDYLIFAFRENKTGWLNELVNGTLQPIVTLPISGEAEEIQVGRKSYACRVRELGGNEAVPSLGRGGVPLPVYAPIPGSTPQDSFVPARFRPSHLEDSNTMAAKPIPRVIQLGSRFPVTGNPEMDALGTAVHGFLAADHVEIPLSERRMMAQSILNRHGISAITADTLLVASDRLHTFIRDRYEGSSMYREWPVHIRRGMQKASGWVDVLIDTTAGWVIIDHKTFPGKQKDWMDHALQYTPQVMLYAEAVEKATGKSVSEIWIHMPVVGAMIGLLGGDPI